MFFREYADLGRLDAETAAQHAACEREWFGAAPFGEYAICSDPACRAVVSADEVHGRDMTRDYVPLARLETAMPGGPSLPCPSCGGPIELLMPPAAYADYVRRNIHAGAFGVLGFDDCGVVRAASLASVRPLGEALEALNYRSGYDLPALAAAIGARLGVAGAAAMAMPVLYWNRVGVSVPHRGGGITRELVRRQFALRPDVLDLPTVGDTFPTTLMYRMLTTRGFDILARDHQGGVLTFGRRAGDVLAAPTRPPAPEPPMPARRHYRGFPTLPPLAADPAWHVLTGPALDEVWVRRLACLFREAFAAADYGQYLFYPSRMEPVAPAAVFGAEAVARGLGLDALDALDRAALAVDGEPPLFWHHPQVTLERLRDKLLGRGHAVACTDAQGALFGMVFGYPASLREAFAGEEWENPVVYSGWTPPRLRSFARFCERLGAVLGPVDAETPVFVLNCIAVAPQRRSAGLGRALLHRFIETLPAALVHGRPLLGEVKIGSPWHRSLDPARVLEVPGALDEAADAPRLIVARTPDAYLPG